MFYVVCVVGFSVRQLVARGNLFLASLEAVENGRVKIAPCGFIVFLTKNSMNCRFIKQLIIR
jgi:hypothetical protein